MPGWVNARNGTGLNESAVLFPGSAWAANTLSLSMEPAIPGKGKPFQLIATGNADPAETYDAHLQLFFAPGSSGCASTAALEDANPANHPSSPATDVDPVEGPFDERYVLGADPFKETSNEHSHTLRNGMRAGHYRVCGYLSNNTSGNNLPLAAARLPFTVGGTCESATAKHARAQSDRKAAKRTVRKAKRAWRNASTRKQRRKAARALKAAKRALKKANRRLKTATEDRDALC